MSDNTPIFCYHCGSTDVTWMDGIDHDFVITCKNCGAISPGFKTYLEAVNFWNTRFESPELPEWLKNKLASLKYEFEEARHQCNLEAKYKKSKRHTVRIYLISTILRFRRDQP